VSAAATTHDPLSLRRVLGSFATGVTIITTRDSEGRKVGLTANSFNTVSLDPPLVLWSLRRQASGMSAFRSSRHWAVHVLAADQEALSNRFAQRCDDRFADLDLTAGHADVPLLRGCAAVLQCRTVSEYEGGDHLIFVGEVLEFEHRSAEPLIFHGGNYAQLLR
jgi:3-hydroxy-9,10-secoandrosta-1,3,5(10)-triene-9,17-dione monooxygenase reductase component